MSKYIDEDEVKAREHELVHICLNGITVKPFKFKYMQDLIDLHSSQKYEQLDTIEYRTLPKIGVIVYINKMPVAAGFLRRLEPCYAQIDTLVSNAYAGAIMRNEGITKVVDYLINEAKRLKIQGIICHTKDAGTLMRAQTLGFHIVPQTIIALLIKE